MLIVMESFESASNIGTSPRSVLNHGTNIEGMDNWSRNIRGGVERGDKSNIFKCSWGHPIGKEWRKAYQ